MPRRSVDEGLNIVIGVYPCESQTVTGSLLRRVDPIITQRPFVPSSKSAKLAAKSALIRFYTTTLSVCLTLNRDLNYLFSMEGTPPPWSPRRS